MNTQYVPPNRYQPIFSGVSEQGEILWSREFKQSWHTKMFPVKYEGDFSEQWMWLCVFEKGHFWGDL